MTMAPLAEGFNGGRLDKELTRQTNAMKIRCRVLPYHGISHLSESREKIQLPEPRIEPSTLKLLDKIAIDIFKVRHHRFD